MNSIIEQIMHERFGHDRLITIGTSVHNIPYLRAVNAVYQDGWFYFLTLSTSSKMKQMEKNPVTAVCGEWFNGHGTAFNLGTPLKKENRAVVELLHQSFENWMNDAHISTDSTDIILCGIQMKTGVLYSHGKRYDVLFNEGR